MRYRCFKSFFGVVILIVGSGIWNNTLSKNSNYIVIYWSGTKSFDAIVNNFSVSSKKAYQLLLAKTRDHPDRFFDRFPVFIIENKYFFTEPLKSSVPLQGFYVDGFTGKIEYRKSDVLIKSKQKTIKNNSYSDVVAIE